MVDTGLIAEQLRAKGYKVGHIEAVSENAGDWIFNVDGAPIDLEQVRLLLAEGTDARHTGGDLGTNIPEDNEPERPKD